MRITNILLLLLLSYSMVFAQEEPSEELELSFSIAGGFFEDEVDIKLISPGATIYYTTNGNYPTKRASKYKKSIRIKRTTIIRAVAYSKDLKSKITSQTYFINEPQSDFPLVSIGISPWILFDPEKGLFVDGENMTDTTWRKEDANFWSRKEVTASTEIYESNGECVFSNLTGFRLFGGMSRLFPQKSISVVARDQYGDDRIRYPVFGKKGPKKFKSLIFRNSGSDFGKTHFRDAMMTGLVKDWDMDRQLYRPSHLYINGRYWGIYNIREKVNRFFLNSYHDIDKDSIDLIEHRMIRKQGSKRHYLKMMKFVEENSLENPSNYAYLQTLMDVNNFMDYKIAQIYFDNEDAGGNIKCWRPQEEDGRWRWILYDTDWGFGLHSNRAYRNNSLAFHTTPNGPEWPNPPWSTLMLRKLLENPDFEQAFINRFADYMNTDFTSDNVLSEIDKYYTLLKPEIPRHLRKWRLSKKKWEKQVNIMRQFAEKRPEHLYKHLTNYFELEELTPFEASASHGGKIIINNNLEIEGSFFDGQYFSNIPISVRAIANYGYKFSHWEGIKVHKGEKELNFLVTDNTRNVRAVFKKYTHPMSDKVIINEVSANNKKSGDWLELYNASKEEINLKDWIITDKKNSFTFPSASIAPNDYLVICEDSLKFQKSFPMAYNFISGLGFGINKRKERLQLFAHDGAMVDSLAYDIEPTDSVFTFNLLLPNLDNSDLDNWEHRSGIGSPNEPNPYFVEARIQAVQRKWMQVGLLGGVVILCLVFLVIRQREKTYNAS